MCGHNCRCGITEFCVLCCSPEYTNEPDYRRKTRLVVEVCEIHGKETIIYEWKYLCDDCGIKEDECLVINQRLMTAEEMKKACVCGHATFDTYSIHDKNEILNLFDTQVFDVSIALKYCKDEHDRGCDCYITPNNYYKIKQIAEQNTLVVREENYK